MKYLTINLYDYFKLKKPDGAKGFLTCYLHEQTPEICKTRLHPAMLILPGGGYQSVSSRENEPVALSYFSEGMNCFSLDYSIHPLTYPTAFIEAALAMVYIRKNSVELNVNKDFVSAIGFSAGGHLCGCLATLFNSDCFDFLHDDKKLIKPTNVLLIYPVISSKNKPHMGSFINLCENNKELIDYLSLENRVSKDSSPAFIISTFEDSCVPCLNSLLIAQAYQSNNVPFSLHIFEKGPHGLSLGDYRVYNKSIDISNISTSFHKWVSLSIDWLKDRGIVFKD